MPEFKCSSAFCLTQLLKRCSDEYLYYRIVVPFLLLTWCIIFFPIKQKQTTKYLVDIISSKLTKMVEWQNISNGKTKTDNFRDDYYHREYENPSCLFYLPVRKSNCWTAFVTEEIVISFLQKGCRLQIPPMPSQVSLEALYTMSVQTK